MAPTPEHSELGKKSAYENTYNPAKLFPIPRANKRREINIDPDNIPFQGFDIWNHYEVSWLNDKGKPMVAIANIIIPCTSPNIIESKSMKLYFNTFNNHKFTDIAELTNTITSDLSAAAGAAVTVNLKPIATADAITNQLAGLNLDEQDIACDTYIVDPQLLTTSTTVVTETLCSDLLKSNCLVTGQPDWGSIQITYTGPQIDHAGLLKYIISFRDHNEFHEQCIERVFTDIMCRCKPTELTVYGRYTRRGGVDINPLRSTQEIKPQELTARLVRQ